MSLVETRGPFVTRGIRDEELVRLLRKRPSQRLYEHLQILPSLSRLRRHPREPPLCHIGCVAFPTGLGWSLCAQTASGSRPERPTKDLMSMCVTAVGCGGMGGQVIARSRGHGRLGISTVKTIVDRAPTSIVSLKTTGAFDTTSFMFFPMSVGAPQVAPRKTISGGGQWRGVERYCHV